MNKATLKALRGSITKWERIVVGKEVDRGTDNCPLCRKFFNPDWWKGRNYFCDGCPVRQASGRPNCLGTPYTKWSKAIQSESRKLTGVTLFYTKAVFGPQTQQAAIDEHAFLVSLLPEEER